MRQPVTWERNGGLGFHGLQRLGECTRYDHERDRTCDSTLPECGDSMEIDPADVQAAIDHPDVQAALAQSPVFYGTDPRFVDGDILRVEIGGTLIEIGNDCPDPDVFPGCRDIPAGVAALATRLTQLKLQQDLRGSCAGPDLCRLPFELSPCMGRMAGLYYFSTETGSCEQLPYGKCMSNANVFETQWECRATCGVGPCVYGTPLNPDDPCVGAVVGAGRCFEDAHAACTCECYTAGASVSACAVLEQVPAYATCE